MSAVLSDLSDLSSNLALSSCGWLVASVKISQNWEKKPWSHSIEKETLLRDALIPSSTALALLGFASSSYMQRSQFQNHFLICTSCSCERDFVKNDEQVLTGTPSVLICCKCSLCLCLQILAEDMQQD